MGQTNEMSIEMQEEEIANSPKVSESEYYELIGRLQRKEEVLSYSSLKEFGKSPRNFINYKLQPKKPQSESQIFGSVCDVLLTEPNKFDEKYMVVDNVPTTDNQIGFCNDLIAGKTPKEAKELNNPRGDAQGLAEYYKAYCDAYKSGKQSISTALKEQAEAIVENLKKSELVMQFVDSCTKFQNKKEWEYKGWKFKGFTDAEGTMLIIDFKYSKDSNPDVFERDIIKYDYFMQMGMYAQENESLPECYFIVYDKSMNF